jgi:hypothetical protein
VKILLSWHFRKAEFQYPCEPIPRTAVLEPWFASRRSDSRVRVFESGELDPELERFNPQAIAASWQRLGELATPERRREIIAPTHAVVVLSRAFLHRGVWYCVSRREPFAPLGAEGRERLWRTFRVPVFEQLIGPRGVLLATECIAHDGMHIESPHFRRDGNIDGSPCGCGRTTPRLLEQPVERMRAVAAYAR